MIDRRGFLAASGVTLASTAVRAAPVGEAFADSDDATGWKILSLRRPGRGGKALQAKIAADAGGNLFSLALGDDELLAQPEKLAGLPGARAGSPILFPTPNRIRDSAFTFEGK